MVRGGGRKGGKGGGKERNKRCQMENDGGFSEEAKRRRGESSFVPLLSPSPYAISDFDRSQPLLSIRFTQPLGDSRSKPISVQSQVLSA